MKKINTKAGQGGGGSTHLEDEVQADQDRQRIPYPPLGRLQAGLAFLAGRALLAHRARALPYEPMHAVSGRRAVARTQAALCPLR